jgi:hypothetical protein
MKTYWEHILKDEFNHLLMTQIVILAAYPFFQVFEAKFPIIPLLLLISIVPALWVGLPRRVFIAVISIGALAFLLNLATFWSGSEVRTKAHLILLILYAVFYFLAISILIKKISSKTVVTADTIKGGISIYFLLGLFWATLYMIMLHFDLNALSNMQKETASFDCYYYSFTTLTTLGYGDIAPVAKYAKILAIMEAVAGPVYLAIFVAQIIGMNIAQKMKS